MHTQAHIHIHTHIHTHIQTYRYKNRHKHAHAHFARHTPATSTVLHCAPYVTHTYTHTCQYIHLRLPPTLEVSQAVHVDVSMLSDWEHETTDEVYTSRYMHFSFNWKNFIQQQCGLRDVCIQKKPWREAWRRRVCKCFQQVTRCRYTCRRLWWT